MKQIVELFLENLSSREQFCFGIKCEECGAVYRSTAERFSKASLVPESKSKQIIHDAVYELEMSAYRKKAVSQLAEHINRCPICKKLVCNNCFLICEDIDMCMSCANKLEEKGVPVYQEAIEAFI